jgi:A/G-specific adenine glycosylase
MERWFAIAARRLPWREARTGYGALVAEAMLQQTQVSRVIEPYRRFLEAFPDCPTLASASEDRVLAMWRGLGYYRRARSLHAAAQMIVQRFGGQVPRDAGDLRELPGVGRYTAGAIASIVFGQREPIVDGNVQRVLMRVHGRRTPAGDSTTIAWTWQAAEELVQAARDPGAFNEAMMELGATICTPRAPQCNRCPIRRMCAADRQGLQHRIPLPKSRAAQAESHHHAVAVHRGMRVLLVRRPLQGMWAGMWQVPTIESPRALNASTLRRRLGLRIGPLQRLGEFSHLTTHRRITFHVYQTIADANVGGIWRQPSKTSDLAISAAQQRVLDMIRDLDP